MSAGGGSSRGRGRGKPPRPMRLLGWETHGFKKPEDLTSETIKSLAKKGWLTNQHYLAVLYNPQFYTDLMVSELPFQDVPAAKDSSGCIFLCEKTEDSSEAWPLNKSLYMEIGGVCLMRADVSYNVTMERRIYALLATGDFVIWHYYENLDREQQDRAAVEAAMHKFKSTVDDLESSSKMK
ncbi:hypothetical protein ACP4OV_017998 [Aristida adscensionis]